MVLDGIPWWSLPWNFMFSYSWWFLLTVVVWVKGSAVAIGGVGGIGMVVMSMRMCVMVDW